MPLRITRHITALDVQDFTEHAAEHPEDNFLVTEIGCGLAGYLPAQIAPLFTDAAELENVWLPERFWSALAKRWW